MKKPNRRATRITAALATPVAIVGAGALIYQASYAAFSGQTRNSGNDWSTGSVALTDDDNGVSRFQVTNMTPGDTETRCIKVTANATVPGEVRGYAVNPVTSSAGLEDRVKVTVQSGTGGSFSNCSGFTPIGTVVPTMSLTQLASYNSYAASPLGGWDVPVGTSSRTYQITWTFDTSGMTQTEIDRLQGSHTGIDFQWEMQSD